MISDSHGEVSPVRQALERLDRLGVEATIHCGDVGLEIVSLLKGRTVHFVRGNTDDPDLLREAVVEPEHTFHDRLGTLEIAGIKIAFLHGHDVKLLHQTIHSGRWDLVCYGHTHAFSQSREGHTLVVNPGALSRTENPSMAVVELPSLEVTEIRMER
ncbi:MAG: YfcE family phosphodiesterase [Pirellulales bacterium]|nr:YfcE family phosphodiesterase [Pirellulales bacterium]